MVIYYNYVDAYFMDKQLEIVYFYLL